MKLNRPVASKEAFDLFHRGNVALAGVESNGVRVDVKYLEATITKNKRDMEVLSAELQADKLWKRWKSKFGFKAGLGKLDQLGSILFVDMKHPVLEHTDTGKPKMDEKNISRVNLPFIKAYVRLRKLQKLQSTYLLNLRRHTTAAGFFHPNFNLHTAESYRSSSGSNKEEEMSENDFNFQNIPSRNPEVTPVIRRAFVPRPGRHLVEIDFSGVEVRVSACYHKDPNMIRYINDPSSDMHLDTACKMFRLDKKRCLENADFTKLMKKGLRDVSKNSVVFAEFYGSYYVDCAKAVWELMTAPEASRFVVPYETGKDGKPLHALKWLRRQGITELGEVPSKEDRDPPPPKRGTFLHRMKEVEKHIWEEMFPGYAAWKKKYFRDYLERGYFRTLTGFVHAGVYRRNQVVNYPIQGSAFHCLLWSLSRLQEWLTKYKMRSCIVGQIHDSLILDVHPAELDDVCYKAREIMTERLPKAWKWINVPLEVEHEVCPIDADWHQKRQWVDSNGKWSLKA